MTEQFAYEMAAWAHSPDLRAGACQEQGGPDHEAAMRVRRLAPHEYDGVRHFKQPAERSRDEYGGLLSLLLEAIAMDSQKHEKMLRFVEQRLAGRD